MTSLAHFEKVAKAIETDACDITMPFGDFEAIRFWLATVRSTHFINMPI